MPRKEYQDYYAILGVDKNAGAEQIKSAYRKLAKKYHPDVNKSTRAEEEYKKINEAYEVLSDPQKRQTYDQLGPDWQNAAGAGGFGGFENFGGFSFSGESTEGFSDFFQSLFGGARRHSARTGRDLEVSVTVTIDEAVQAPLKRTLDVNGRQVDITLPRGFVEGTRLRLRGLGEGGRNGGPAGDLFLTVHLAPDNRFEPQGADLETRLQVLPWDAVLGGTAVVATPWGDKKIKIAPGTKGGTKLRLQGKGLPLRGEDRAGDLFARIEIATPQKIDEQRAALWQQLKDLG